MNMVWDTVLAFIASIGGAGAIVYAIVRLSVNLVVSRLEQRYQATLDKELEKYKTELDRRSYVSKVRFDKEFELFSELSHAMLDMTEKASSFVYTNKPSGYEEAEQACVRFHRVLISNASFISKDFFDSFRELSELCSKQIRVFNWAENLGDQRQLNERKIKATEDCYDRIDEIDKKGEELIKMMRAHLECLDVIT